MYFCGGEKSLENKTDEMKQIPILIVVFAYFGTTVFAQSAFVPVGGDSQSNNGSVNYTVGQIAVQTSTNSNGDIALMEGVQQPYEIVIIGVDEYPQIVLNALVYPNPTDNLAELHLNGFEIPISGLSAKLYDGKGKMLQTLTVTDDITTIQIGHYATGIYFLEVGDGKRVLKTFKVVRR